MPPRIPDPPIPTWPKPCPNCPRKESLSELLCQVAAYERAMADAHNIILEARRLMTMDQRNQFDEFMEKTAKARDLAAAEAALAVQGEAGEC